MTCEQKQHPKRDSINNAISLQIRPRDIPVKSNNNQRGYSRLSAQTVHVQCLKPGSEGAKVGQLVLSALRVEVHTITKPENGPSTTRSLRKNVDVFNYDL